MNGSTNDQKAQHHRDREIVGKAAQRLGAAHRLHQRKVEQPLAARRRGDGQHLDALQQLGVAAHRLAPRAVRCCQAAVAATRAWGITRLAWGRNIMPLQAECSSRCGSPTGSCDIST